MAIAQYTDKFWFPDGTLATGIAVRIFPLNSNILAPLFADLAGTVPLANPLTTSGTGTVSFFAEEGEYWMHADSEAFRVPIGLPPPVDPAAFSALQADVLALQIAAANLEADVIAAEKAAQSTLSTGVFAGGDISVNGVSSSAIDISSMVGYITSFEIDPFNPVITRVEYPGGTVEMDAGALTRTATVWLMDVDQNIIQQALLPSNAQRRNMIMLGFTAQESGVIIADQSLPIILQQPANQLVDLMTSLGAFNISGNVISPNGANQMFNQTAGTIFSQAFNHFVGPIQTDDPHVSTTIAQTPASFRHVTRSSATFGTLENLLDVGNYDVAGVVTPIGGGVNSSTVHRVYLFANNTATEQLVLQYGQFVYSSLASAVASVGSGTFVPNPLTRAAALIGWIVATRTAVNLSDPTQAVFVQAGKFSTP
jgi:hypothetical protein